jgi:hypothetical protein
MNTRTVRDLGPVFWKKPKSKNGNKAFNLANIGLTSLDGCPEVVKYSIIMDDNPLLTSLIGGPKEVKGDYDVDNSGLLSLVGSPILVGGDFNISHSESLGSLVGGPKEVKGNYAAYCCGLLHLDGLPIKIGGYLDLGGNKLTSLQGINNLKEIDGLISANGCPITSHILGVFFIKGCTVLEVSGYGSLPSAVEIVNKHISKGRAGLLPCTQELIEAGLADFAQI